MCLLFVDNISPNLQCSMKDMIYPASFNGMTPLHAVAVSCTENLPPGGLGNSLTVTNLPSSYTPRILLKLFQGRYPSAYRATIPPTTLEGRKVNICLLSWLRFLGTAHDLFLVSLYRLFVVTKSSYWGSYGPICEAIFLTIRRMFELKLTW